MCQETTVRQPPRGKRHRKESRIQNWIKYDRLPTLWFCSKCWVYGEKSVRRVKSMALCLAYCQLWHWPSWWLDSGISIVASQLPKSMRTSPCAGTCYFNLQNLWLILIGGGSFFQQLDATVWYQRIQRQLWTLSPMPCLERQSFCKDDNGEWFGKVWSRVIHASALWY